MMKPVAALKKDEFYVVVDEFVDDPNTGELMLKQPVFRTKFLAVNIPAHTDANQIAHAPVKVMVDPDETNGVYPVRVVEGFSGEKSQIMQFKVKQYDGKIIGPFESPKEALLAKHTARPKTKSERVNKLEQEGEQKDAELAALREKLSAMEQGAKNPE